MSDFKALAKHSANYLAATIATKALAFISIPVYTRLLTVAEYGVMQVFLSMIGIVHVLLTLNTEVAVSRYYYDAESEQDFKEFVTTTVKITFRIWCAMTVVMLFCTPWLAKGLSFSHLLTVAMIPVASYQATNSIFIQIYQPLLQSRKIAVVSSIQAYLAFGLSVVFMLLLNQDKYYGYVLGTIAAMIILSVYLSNQIKPFYVKCKIKREHVKYILNYCLPYIPYTLSGVIIVQFGKIVMSDYGGFETAGIYSFMSNIAALMMIVISVVHSAWNPYYLQYMTDKDYTSIAKDYNLIWRVTLVCGVTLSLFAKELGVILGKPEYLSMMHLLPLMVLGYLFYQWSYVYLRSTGFAKKTIWNAVAVILSGIANVALNVVLVKKYDALGITISFAISYFVMLVVSYFVNRYVLKLFTPLARNFGAPLFATIPFLALSSYVNTLGGNLDIKYFVIKLIVLTVFSAIILWLYFPQLIAIVKAHKGKD